MKSKKNKIRIKMRWRHNVKWVYFLGEGINYLFAIGTLEFWIRFSVVQKYLSNWSDLNMKAFDEQNGSFEKEKKRIANTLRAPKWPLRHGVCGTVNFVMESKNGWQRCQRWNARKTHGPIKTIYILIYKERSWS